MFEASDVYVSYGKSRVINGMSVKIDKGEKIAILGRNGVGKTTFLKSIMGLLPVSEGKIIFDDKDITPLRLP